MKQGTLIAIEGIDGAGKTTQAQLLARALRDAGNEVVLTHEPTHGQFGEMIRSATVQNSPKEELELFMEDRREHVSEVIAPALSKGQIVVSDRYFLSTVSYQGARGLAFEWILEENEARFPSPDLAVVLEISASDGLARVRARGNGINPVFEREEYLREVAVVFHKIERSYIQRIDARDGIEEVHKAIVSAVSPGLRRI